MLSNNTMTKILRHRFVSSYMRNKINFYGSMPELAYMLLNTAFEFMNESQNNISTNSVISYVKNMDITDDRLSDYRQLLDKHRYHPDHRVKTVEQFHDLIVTYLTREIAQNELSVLKKKRLNNYYNLFKRS